MEKDEFVRAAARELKQTPDRLDAGVYHAPGLAYVAIGYLKNNSQVVCVASDRPGDKKFESKKNPKQIDKHPSPYTSRIRVGSYLIESGKHIVGGMQVNERRAHLHEPPTSDCP